MAAGLRASGEKFTAYASVWCSKKFLSRLEINLPKLSECSAAACRLLSQCLQTYRAGPVLPCMQRPKALSSYVTNRKIIP